MKAFVIALALFELSGLIFNTEAELSLTVMSPLGDSTIHDLNIPKDFECNAEATFICEVKPYTDSVVWQINGHSYALCIFQNCFTYPPFPENHLFTMDLANNVFNLTVNPVTNATNNNIYKCDDGITARSVEATVHVYPTNESLKMDETAEDRITVTTGCVYPKGINDVIFEWFITKSNTTLDPEPLTSQENDTEIFNCTEMLTCTVEETSHFNNTVVFDVSDEGEEYFIYVSVKHNSSINRPSAVLLTERRYKVKNRAEDVKICYCPIYIIIIILLVVRLQSIQNLYFGYFLYKTFPENGLKNSTDEYKMKGLFAGIPLVGIVLSIKTACGEVKQAVHHSVSNCKIAISVITTVFDPAVGICVTSILFVCSHEETMAKSWKFLIMLFIGCFGCLIVIGTEVVLLIQCKVFCWDGIYYIPLMILYLVMLWIYMTVTVIFVKYLLTTYEKKLNRTEVLKDVCNDCSRDARYQCKMCGELICEECLRSHKKKHITNQREEDSKFLCESCSTLVISTYCMECEKFLCVRCIKWHEKRRHDLLRHQQHNDDRERKFCCDDCKESRNYIATAHAFCLTCSAYLCTLCLKATHQTCTLLWIQKQTDGTGERLCCEEIEDHKELPLEGVCLTCESYICTRCLKDPKVHRKHRVASHQQEHSTSGRRLSMCCNIAYTEEEQKTINYCLDCQCYFCRNCFSTHRQHRMFYNQSDSLEATTEILCKGCENDTRLPVESYNLTNDEFLCAKCFEDGHKSSRRKRTLYTNPETVTFKDLLKKNIRPCEIHTVLGGASPSHVEVYCLVCKIYMCRVCFSRHRRIAEFWIKSQKDNLFYCKLCKNNEHVYPVECCSLKTGDYLCANCYGSYEQDSSGQYAAGRDKDNRGQFAAVRDKDRRGKYAAGRAMDRRGQYAAGQNDDSRGQYVAEQNHDNRGQYAAGPDDDIIGQYAAGPDKNIEQMFLNVKTPAIVSQITFNFKNKSLPCQIHKFPFNEQEKEVPGSVYCLVCKLYLCKHCFELHRRLKDVWQQKQQRGPPVPYQVDSSTEYIGDNYITTLAKHPVSERTNSYHVSEKNIGLMVWWHFPLAGTVIASLHWCIQLRPVIMVLFPIIQQYDIEQITCGRTLCSIITQNYILMLDLI